MKDSARIYCACMSGMQLLFSLVAITISERLDASVIERLGTGSFPVPPIYLRWTINLPFPVFLANGVFVFLYFCAWKSKKEIFLLYLSAVHLFVVLIIVGVAILGVIDFILYIT